MQLAKHGFHLSLVTAMMAYAGSAFALLPPQPAASAPAIEPAKALTAAAVQAVAIGKNNVVEAGTLRELEDLQRRTALAEARKKLNDLQGTTLNTAAQAPAASVATVAATPLQPLQPAGAAQTMKKPSAPLRQKSGASLSPAAAMTPSAPLTEFVAPPVERVLKLIVVGSRSRADLVASGKVTTVKVGDKLGRWTVSEISADGVTVERRLTPMPAPGVEPANAASSPSMAPAVKEYDYAKLQKANEFDIMGTQPVASGARPVGVVVPPLPQAVKPDSSYVAPVAPLLTVSTP
ncbi:hypothetical protein ABIC83_002669 [Roseateles asaccharophilus]|uniref:hypothetical protein n=1 Tax=Roseateles asaccharophilus TaxID=582607 RepID=UPI0038341FFB